MSSEMEFKQYELLFEKVDTISNKLRFRIIAMTQNNQLSITELSSKLKLSYTKCADYVRMLEKKDLIQKTRVGKETKVKSKVILNRDKIEFL